MGRRLLLGLGIFCLLAGLWPLPFGVRHVGMVFLLLLGLYLVALCRGWDSLGRLPRLRRGLALCTAVGICGLGVLSLLMLRQAFLERPPEQEPVTVIVLGGHVIGDQPSLILRYRLDTALGYLRENPQADCIVTGGQGHDEDYPEARVMAAYLTGRGIAAERISEEALSTNTRENLRFARDHMGDPARPVVIVTDSFHQLRASIYARQEGLDTLYSLSSPTPWGLFPSYWARDLLGVVAAWLEIH